MNSYQARGGLGDFASILRWLRLSVHEFLWRVICSLSSREPAPTRPNTNNIHYNGINSQQCPARRCCVVEMRLLNARTVTLEEFFENEAPGYAILSHTWGKDEVSLQEIQGSPPLCKSGYTKILKACQQALRDGLDYVWVDTCCIDKTSSAELSQAINSMFRWYEKAWVCYAYLVDVSLDDERNDAFRKSRWFTRGWTLQELLAPKRFNFYSSDWSYIASREDLADIISTVTKIDQQYLRSTVQHHRGAYLQQASVAERMSWASTRQTTRTEDIAYCLLGIFGISMPLIYGEGEMAFIRLQEEILKRSDDQTLFAWTFPQGEAPDLNTRPRGLLSWPFNTPRHHSDYPVTSVGVFAQSPANFQSSGDFIPCDVEDQEHDSAASVTNRGVRVSLPISKSGRTFGMLQCRPKNDPTKLLAIPLERLKGNQFARAAAGGLLTIDFGKWRRWKKQLIYLLERSEYRGQRETIADYSISVRHLPTGFTLEGVSSVGVSSLGEWSPSRRIMFATGTPLSGDEETYTVILETSLRAGERMQPCRVMITLTIKYLSRYVLARFFQVLVTTDIIALPSDGWMRQFQRPQPPPPYLDLPDGVRLYVNVRSQTVFRRKLLVVDVEKTNKRTIKWWLFAKFRWDCLLYRILKKFGLRTAGTSRRSLEATLLAAFFSLVCFCGVRWWCLLLSEDCSQGTLIMATIRTIGGVLINALQGLKQTWLSGASLQGLKATAIYFGVLYILFLILDTRGIRGPLRIWYLIMLAEFLEIFGRLWMFYLTIVIVGGWQIMLLNSERDGFLRARNFL
jgi:hypothetical protein